MTQPTSDVPAGAPAARGLEPQSTSRLRSALALYGLALRQHRHGKRWLIMALLLVLPALIALLSRMAGVAIPPRSLEFNLVFMFIPQGLLPLLALVYASGILQDEQEEQTITYILMRPISRWVVYISRLAAAVTAALGLTLFSVVLTYLAIFAGTGVHGVAGRCLAACAVHGLAVVTYCGLFGLMGLLTRRVLIVGIVYIAMVEGLLANIPFTIRMITVIYYARLIAYRLLPFSVNTGYRIHDLAAETWQFNVLNDPKLKLYPSSWVCVAVLLSAAVAFSAAAAWVCTGREFYVKTPEKTG